MKASQWHNNIHTEYLRPRAKKMSDINKWQHQHTHT